MSNLLATALLSCLFSQAAPAGKLDAVPINHRQLALFIEENYRPSDLQLTSPEGHPAPLEAKEFKGLTKLISGGKCKISYHRRLVVSCPRIPDFRISLPDISEVRDYIEILNEIYSIVGHSLGTWTLKCAYKKDEVAYDLRQISDLTYKQQYDLVEIYRQLAGETGYVTPEKAREHLLPKRLALRETCIDRLKRRTSGKDAALEEIIRDMCIEQAHKIIELMSEKGEK